MSGNSAAPGTLRIQRLQNRYLVSSEHPQPERVQARLDRAIQAHGIPALQKALRPVLESGSDGILLVRRLEARLALDAGGLDETVLGQAVGQRIAGEITRLAERPRNDENVRFFPDWASYVAQYLLDRLRGRADGAWYYRPFAGLRSLGLSQALSAGLLMRPESAARALAMLSQRGELAPVLRALHESDASRVLGVLRSRSPISAHPDRTMLPELLAAWAHSILPDLEPGSARQMLALWGEWVRQGKGSARTGAGLGETSAGDFWSGVDLLVDFAGLLHGAANPQALLDSLLDRDVSGSLALMAADPLGQSAARVAEVLAFFGEDKQALAETARLLAPQFAGTSRLAVSSRMISTCGGLFWLLPSLLALQAEDWLDAAAPDVQIGSVWRYWLALKCLGAPQWEQARRDPVLLLALGLERAPDEQEQQAAADALAGSPGKALLHSLWDVLREQRRASGSPLVLELADLPDERRVGILRDMRRDDWLLLAEPPGDLAALALQVQAELGHAPLREAVFDFNSRSTIATDASMENFLRKARPAAADLAYLHLPALPLAADLALTPPARAVLRTFAGRLMGFSWSSLPYLYSNFLAGAAQVEFGPGTIQVHLPSPPLHSVLRMAGFVEETLTPAWLGGRSLHLHWGDEA